jgi:flagellar biosynthesis protein FlhA
MKLSGSWQNLVLPAGVVACLLVLVMPLPAGILDVLLVANLATALIILLTTLAVQTPLEFSLFPTLLLTTTLSRLVLNVASTRLILTRAGSEQLDAAGHVIRAFGQFVTGDHVMVGLVIFSIIVVIQFVVITKGSSRISEVAARFALDGMPGRQMAIDADLNAGVIDAQQAMQLRREVADQSDFFGAMDGASKFVRGDAIAGVFITLINIFGGFLIGVFEHGMSLGQASAVFTKLTIGDGLVSQVPALLISLAAGLLVTRSARSMDLPREFLRQLFSRPQVLGVASVFLVLLIFTRLPAIPLLAIAIGCGGLSVMLARRPDPAEAVESRDDLPAEDQAKLAERRIEDYLTVDPMELEIGVQLIRLADPSRGGDLLGQITESRRRVAADLGIVLPKVRIRDNQQLNRRGYRIKIAGTPVVEGTVHPGRLLAIAPAGQECPVRGVPDRDPYSGRTAAWISVEDIEEAQRSGCTLLEPAGVLAAQLRRVAREHANELLTRDATRHLVEELRKSSPAVVEELIPGLLALGDVQRVLQRMLEEGVPIRPLGTILEALGDHAHETKDPILLAEAARRRLSRVLSTRYRDAQRILRVVTLDPAMEERIAGALDQTLGTLAIRMPPQTIAELNDQLLRAVEPLVAAGYPPIVLVAPDVRAAVKQLTSSRNPELTVLSYDEISRDTRVESARVVGEAVPTAA